MRQLLVPIFVCLVSFLALGQVPQNPGALLVAHPRAINSGGIVNAANYTTPIAAGSVASAFGTYAVSGVYGASGVPLPGTLGGVSLQFNGSVNAPLFFASGTQ